MTDHPFDRRSLVLSALFSFLLILICGLLGLCVMTDKDIQRAAILPLAAMQIDSVYASQVDWDKAAANARKAMFAGLDRYSDFVDERQFNQLDEDMSGGYVGIGVSVVKHDQGVLIMSVRENGPAATAGLLTGDIITAVDSVSAAGHDIEEISRRLRGREGTAVRVTILRPASHDTLTVPVMRQHIEFQHVSYAGYTPEGFLYIRLLDFDYGASTDVRAALDSLLLKKDQKPRGLILDLKGNPGGLFEEAYRTANLFLNKGDFIVGTKGRSRWDNEIHRATGHDVTNGLPMAVIVDRGSASAAEIVSGALQQDHRAVLVGDTTFGKGLVQGFTHFPDGGGLKLTISRYFLNGDLFLNKFDSNKVIDTATGLAPNYYVEMPERDPFVAALETSLLLPRFAYEHQEEIVNGPPPVGPESTWAEQFVVYAQTHGFRYASPRTEAADRLVKLAESESASPALQKETDRLAALSKRADQRHFLAQLNYVNLRLRQLAFERKYNSYAAYAQVVVKQRPEIKLAEQILLDKRS